MELECTPSIEMDANPASRQGFDGAPHQRHQQPAQRPDPDELPSLPQPQQYTTTTTTPHQKQKAHRSPSPQNDDYRINDDRHYRHNLDSPPLNPASDNSDSHPSPRAPMLVFLLLVGIAIAHAIASGFESMHESNQTQTQNQIPQPSDPSVNDASQGYQSFSREVDDAYLANNEVAYDNRSVNANRDPLPEDTGATASILSRTSQLSLLISHLDASDVVECYVVTRMAHLTNNVASNFGGGGSNDGGNNNGNKRRRLQRMLDEGMASSSTDTAESKVEESAPATSSSATTTPSGPVLIRKSALAFRYRPRVASASHGPHFSEEYSSSLPMSDNLSPGDQVERQKYFELTLEYGPQRTGAAKTSESMPMVHMDMELMDGTSKNNNIGNIGKYVSWENEGRVYYSTHISNEWTEAYYMAPITGVVLDKIIQRAVEYTYKRPRYQPFEVVSIPSNNVILRSSGSDDFVWDMFRDLADLYVDIDPLLVPPRGRVQFYVADPEGSGDEGQGDDRRESGDDEANDSSNGDKSNSRTKRRQPYPIKKVKGPLEGSRAAIFYENFFNCANAIKTGDFSMYLPPPPPSSAPTLLPEVSMAPSMAPSMTSTIAYTKNETVVGEDNSNDDDKNNDTGDAPDDNGEEDNPDDVLTPGDNDNNGNNHTTMEESYDNELDDISNKTGAHHHRLLSSEEIPENQMQLGEKHSNATEEALPDTIETNPEDESIEKGYDDIPGLALGDDDSLIDSTDFDGEEGSEDDPAEAAEKAAIEAVKAAENAAAVVATNTSSAADTAAATNEAAKAANLAKDASVAARSKASAEALLSGDGELMTSVLSSCFSDPKYGIREQIHYDAEHVDGHDLLEGDNEEEGGHVAERRGAAVAYIYLDGDIFFKLNLTAPYWGVAMALETVPPPHSKPEGHGDTVDYAILMLIITGTLFGFLVIMHQVGIVIDKRLRFRHIFHPTMTESDWASDDEFGMGGEQSPLKGGGFSHSELRLTVESIPTSMGGKDGGSSPPTLYCDDLDSTSLVDTPSSSHGIDLEMAQLSSSNTHTDASATTHRRARSSPMKVSFGDRGTPTNGLPVSFRRKIDKSDLVERPSMKTTSKVAMPKLSPRTDEDDFRKLEFNKSSVPELPLDDS